MTKYYRVRTQEQWDWLMQWFEKQGVKCLYDNRISLTHISYSTFHTDVVVVENDGLITWNELNSVADTHDFIEVFQMMEDEKMEDYVTIKDEDLNKVQQKVNTGTFISDEDDTSIDTDMVKELIIPKSLLYPKVRMAEAEKKEFDMAAGLNITPIEFLEEIESSCGDEYPCLFNKMFCSQTEKDNSKAQIEFIRAFADPSITIELIKSTKQ
jgi:hypothetical protein